MTPPADGSGRTVKRREPEIITSDYGPWYVLASSYEDAERAWTEYDAPASLKDAGWMHNVGWDRDSYDLKRQFVQHTGMKSWWEGCRPPADGVETAKVRRAWEVVR